MNNEILNKEIAEKLMAIEGKIRGMDLKADAEFVLKKEGEEGLRKIEERLKELNFPIEYRKVRSMDFYPGGLKALSLLAVKTVLGWDDQIIEEMGRKASKVSLIIKVFVRFFGSLSRFFFKESPQIWNKYWTVGKCVPKEFNESEKFAVVQLQDFRLHPIYCLYLKGYFTTVTRLATGSEKIICQETKCVFRGDPCHEFLLKWE